VLLLVDEVHDGGEDRRLNLSHLRGAVFFANDFIEPSEASSKGGVKMIFNVVIRAK
jgi:hypothetical protein